MNKKITKIISLILMLALLICSTIIVEAYDYKLVQTNIAESYYSPIEKDVLNANFYAENKAILDERVVNSENTVAIYETAFDFSSQKDFDNFITMYNSEKSLNDTILGTDAFFTTVYDKSNDTYSTALMGKENGKMSVGAIYVNDGGSLFNMPEEKTFFTEINKYCNLDTINCKYVIFKGVGSGILVTDGEQELVVLLAPAYYVPIEANTIFTADEFVGELIKYENTIVCGLGIYEINEEGEINYIIGK